MISELGVKIKVSMDFLLFRGNNKLFNVEND